VIYGLGPVIWSPTNVPSYSPDQVSPYPGGASRDVRGTRYGDARVDDSDDYFLTAVQVRQRYGNASDMWLWRRLRDDSNFPRPIEIRKPRYWKLSELIAWERACASPGLSR
jgi:predicted DNA-binding transcriptional regulator AlpA